MGKRIRRYRRFMTEADLRYNSTTGVGCLKDSTEGRLEIGRGYGAGTTGCLHVYSFLNRTRLERFKTIFVNASTGFLIEQTPATGTCLGIMGPTPTSRN